MTLKELAMRTVKHVETGGLTGIPIQQQYSKEPPKSPDEQDSTPLDTAVPSETVSVANKNVKKPR